ncbi:MAG: alpha/beta hydrolase [Clostridia bacterium]|nr:alpha/beta hydrolase [Clostridia bacterium]
MNLKKNLLKAAYICLYIFSALWIIAAACAYALSAVSYIYWIFLAFGLVSLYDAFVITSVRGKIANVKLPKKEWLKLLFCWIFSIVCLPAFILSGIALFRKKDDKYIKVLAREEEPVEVTAGAEPKRKKPFFLASSFITMCISFIMIFALGVSGMAFETSGFTVDVSDFTLTREMTLMYNNGEINGEQYVMENDSTYSVTMYVPETATEDSPAPTVFVLPGFTRTKATMAQYCIELSRRGAVVFSLDPGGQGATTETSTDGANGIEYLVQYVYNNTDDFKFVDRDRFGAVGHSAGGGNVCTLAADMSGSSYDESIIKSVYISGYIKVSSANKYKNLNCNAALSYAYYDEGAFRYQSDTTAFEVIALRFINEVNGASNNYSTVSLDYGYGSISDGTYRIIHREKINHCFEMYDKTSIANTVDFFNETLDMGSDLSGTSQIWFGKEFSNGLALAAAFTFIISLCAVLMKIPFFAKIKKANEQPDALPEEDDEWGDSVPPIMGESSVTAETDGGGGVQTVATAKPLDGVKAKPKSAGHQIIFWSTMILTAIIACLDYIPLANLSIEIFPTGNSASVYTFVFPARMINAILLWAAINGAIGLALFFGIGLLENLYELIKSKITHNPPAYDWDKFKAIMIRRDSGKGGVSVLVNVLKAILLAVIMFCAFYLMDQISYWCFHQDFRFMLISAAPLNARMFVTALEYIPIIFIFYISNSIRVNCSIGREGWKEWKVMLVGALANSVGLAFILLINYVCYFTTGTPFYGYWGNGTEIWLYVNMVFALVVMMFILPIFNRLFYKITGNVWTGAIACCMIFIMMTISASVSYIPMY